MKGQSKRNFYMIPAAVVALAIQSAYLPNDVDAAQTKSALQETMLVSQNQFALHFSDGWINYPGYHQKAADTVIYHYPLNEDQAVIATNYTIQSNDDPAYSTPLNPVAVNRKTKSKATPAPVGDGIVKEHWIYLKLPSVFKEGSTYTITINNGHLNSDVPVVEYSCDSYTQRTDSIHVNQLGYLPDAEAKYAYISAWTGDGGPADLASLQGKEFYIVESETKKKLFTGTVQRRALSSERDTAGNYASAAAPQSPNFNVSDVYECDFSKFTTEQGDKKLVIVVEGLGRSFPFRISSNVYDEAYYVTTRGLYHHRMGIPRLPEHTDWYKPTSYDPNTTDFTVANGNRDGTKRKDIWGWYADAGDFDAYPTHLVIPRYLLTIYELKSEFFKDHQLNLPESGNGLPDLLDEAAWLIHYCKRARGDTGGVLTRVFCDGEGTPTSWDWDGQGTAQPPGWGMGSVSWEDRFQWWVETEQTTGPTGDMSASINVPNDTLNYASLAAQYAYCLNIANGGAEHPESAGWIAEAKKAYLWANDAHRLGRTKRNYTNENKFTAAAWLYKVTGETEYLDVVKNLWTDLNSNLDNTFVEPTHTAKWGIYAYVTTNRAGMDAALKNSMTAKLRGWATNMHRVAFGGASGIAPGGTGMRFSIFQWMPQINGAATTPHVMDAIVAYEISTDKTADRGYLNTVQTTADYMLGGNQLNMCWVTGLGSNPPKQIFNIDSHYGAKYCNKTQDDSIPGIVPYGPYAPPWETRGTGIHSAKFYWTNGIYPEYQHWPIHEGYFNSRYSIENGEYTVWQNIAPAASVYAYLFAVGKESNRAADQGVSQKP